MVKLVALYTQPPDPATFDRHYRETHLPLVRKWQRCGPPKAAPPARMFNVLLPVS